MADLTCLIELKVGSNSGIVEETTVPCTIGVGVGVPDFGLSVLTANVISLEIGLEIGVIIWSPIPAIVIPLEAGVVVSTDFGLVALKSIAAELPLEIGLVKGISLAPEAGKVITKDAGVSVGLVVGISMELKSPSVVPVVLELVAGTKVETNFGLVAVKVSDIAVTVMTDPIAKSVGVSMTLVTPTLPSPKILSSVIAMKVGASLGLVSNAIPPVVVLCNGGTAIGVSCFAPEEVTEIFETWALTGNNFNPSVYSGFRFNSYASYKGKEYAAGPDGIYLLEGPDDDGQEVHPGMRLVTNFGNEKHKRLRSIHLGKCGEKAQVRVEGDTGEGVFEPDQYDHRAVISRNLQSQQFTLDIIDFTQLSQMEITVLPLVKR